MTTNNPTFGPPTPQLPAVDPASGRWSSIWYQFLIRLAQLTPERNIEPLTVGASPFIYEAYTIGHVFITGGTVSAISLTRGSISLACPSGVFIPVAAKDRITVTHSVLPTMTFVPSARA